MAFTMSVPMVAWMRHRGHGWAPAWEMTASMFVPSFAAIALLWAGTVEDTHALLMLQHVAMLPAMAAAMLLRLGEYTGHAQHAIEGACVAEGDRACAQLRGDRAALRAPRSGAPNTTRLRVAT
jgi:hypothetical protein